MVSLNSVNINIKHLEYRAQSGLLEKHDR